MNYSTFVTFDIAPAAAYQALADADKEAARTGFFAAVAELTGRMFTAESDEPEGVLDQLRQVIADAPGDWGLGALAGTYYVWNPRTEQWECHESHSLESGDEPVTKTLEVGGVQLTATYRVGQTHESDPLV